MSRASRSAASSRCPVGDPGGDLGAAGEAELDQDVLDVTFDGPRRNYQPDGDLLVGQTPGDQVGDLVLAAGQRGRGTAGCRQRLGLLVEGIPDGILDREGFTAIE